MAAKLSGLQRKEELAGYLFILPNLIGFLVFLVFPILAAIYLTFTEWELSAPPPSPAWQISGP